MRSRLGLLLGALLALLALAACGGGGDKTGSVVGGGGDLVGAADLIPASAPVVVAVNTDFDDDQAQKVKALLAKFPGRQLLYDQVGKSFASDGVTFAELGAALGPETDVVFLDLEGANNTPNLVALTKPDDEAKLQALLAKGEDDAVSEQVGDWTVIADTQALIDRFKAQSGAKLADNPSYTEAVSGLPSDRLLTLYATGAALKGAVQERNPQAGGALGDLDWIAASADATDDGIGLDFRVKGPNFKAANFTSELLDQLPGGSLIAALFKGSDAALTGLRQLPQLKDFEQRTGVTFQQLAELLSGESAFFVRSGAPLPEVTLALTQANAGSALATLDAIVSKLSPTPAETTEIPGIGAVKKVTVQQFAIYYGTLAGKLVASTSPAGFSTLQDPGQKLVDDPVFKEVKEAAGMPDENAGFLYLNFKDLIPLVQTLAQLGDREIPPVVAQNLAPLRALLLYATAEGTTVSARGFLQIK